MAYLSQLPATNLNWVDIRDTLGLGAENDGRQMMISPSVNSWGFNPPDAGQFDRYYGVAYYSRQAPHDLGAFRRYEHRYRAYTYDKVEAASALYGVGMKVFTKIINEGVSDDAPVGNTVIRITFEYKTPQGTWAAGGIFTGTVHKVGSVTILQELASLGSYWANQVRMSLSSDTPLSSRYFDSRKVPTTTGEFFDDEFSMFEYQDNNKWVIGYNKFPNTLQHIVPPGCTEDLNGFFNLQAQGYANWGAGGVDIILDSIEISNISPYVVTVEWVLRVADNPNFVGAVNHWALTGNEVARGWQEQGFQTSFSGITFEGLSWQQGVTLYCHLMITLSGENAEKVDIGDTNLFNIKFKMS